MLMIWEEILGEMEAVEVENGLSEMCFWYFLFSFEKFYGFTVHRK